LKLYQQTRYLAHIYTFLIIYPLARRLSMDKVSPF
jgi:hypothetical protein